MRESDSAGGSTETTGGDRPAGLLRVSLAAAKTTISINWAVHESVTTAPGSP